MVLFEVAVTLVVVKVEEEVLLFTFVVKAGSASLTRINESCQTAARYSFKHNLASPRAGGEEEESSALGDGELTAVVVVVFGVVVEVVDGGVLFNLTMSHASACGNEVENTCGSGAVVVVASVS